MTAPTTRLCGPITQRVASFFDFEVPNPFPSNTRFCIGFTGNQVILIAMVANAYFAYYAYTSDQPNPQRIAFHQISMAALARLLVDNNVLLFRVKGLRAIEHLLNWMERFGFEGYQLLLQARANVSHESTTKILALTGLIQAWCAFIIAGQIPAFFKLDRSHHSTQLDQDKPILTHLVSPDYNSKGQLILDGLTSLGGIGMIAIGQIYGAHYKHEGAAEEVDLFLTYLGSFLVGKGIGNRLTHYGIEKWRELEKSLQDPNREMVSLMGGAGNSLPWQAKTMRIVSKAIQRFGTEIVCLLPGLVADKPWAVALVFGAAGLGLGSNGRIAKEKIQTMTTEELIARQPDKWRAINSGYYREQRSLLGRMTKATTETFFPFFKGKPNLNDPLNPVEAKPNLAVRINQATTFTFTVGWFAWFMRGVLIEAGATGNEPNGPATIALSTFLGSFTLSTIVSRLLDYFFIPGANRPIFNEACYRILTNPLFLIGFYQCLVQLVQISSQAINGETSQFNYACSVFALGLLGIFFGINQTKDYRERTLTSALAQIFLLREILYDLSGKPNLV